MQRLRDYTRETTQVTVTVTTEHVVRVTGLTADTTYYYSVGSTSAVFAGDDADHFFYTNPLPGTRQPVRAWLLGDSGYGSVNQANVRDAYLTYTGSTRTDLWLHVGDVSQSTGTDAHAPGDQSVMERLMTLLLPALAGVDLVNLTTLSTKMSFSLEQVVLDETVLSLVERVGAQIDVGQRDVALGLHEAAAATGEARLHEAATRLARFLCRIQARSEAHPWLDGAWMRSFDYDRWEYWGSSADAGWGAWSVEAGWTNAWITGGGSAEAFKQGPLLGDYIAQRILSAKDEKNSLLATLLFSVCHFALRPWPWIMVALVSMVVFPHLADHQAAYPRMMAHFLDRPMS